MTLLRKTLPTTGMKGADRAQSPEGPPTALRPTARSAGAHIQDGPVTVVAAWGEEAVVVLLTVGLSVPLEEVPGPDLFLAVCAHKVLGVPCLPHGGHNLTGQTHSQSRRGQEPRPRGLPPLLTCPAMGFLQAPQTPLATVATPSLFRSDCRLPNMLSSWLPGFESPPGGELFPVFPWAMNCGHRESQSACQGLGGRLTALTLGLPIPNRRAD